MATSHSAPLAEAAAHKQEALHAVSWPFMRGLAKSINVVFSNGHRLTGTEGKKHCLLAKASVLASYTRQLIGFLQSQDAVHPHPPWSKAPPAVPEVRGCTALGHDCSKFRWPRHAS